MKKTSTLVMLTLALLCASVTAASALDYSAALGPNGQLGLDKLDSKQLSWGPFGVRSDMDGAIVNAVIPGANGAVITNFRDIQYLSRATLANIKSVPERMGGG